MDDNRTMCEARNWWHQCDLDLAHEGQHECRCGTRFDLRGVRVELSEGGAAVTATNDYRDGAVTGATMLANRVDQ